MKEPMATTPLLGWPEVNEEWIRARSYKHERDPEPDREDRAGVVPDTAGAAGDRAEGNDISVLRSDYVTPRYDAGSGRVAGPSLRDQYHEYKLLYQEAVRRGREEYERSFLRIPAPQPPAGGGRSLGGGIKKVRGSDAVSGKPKAQSTGGSAIPSLKYIRDSIGYAKKDIGHGAGLTEERVRLINSYAGMVMEEINAIDPDEE